MSEDLNKHRQVKSVDSNNIITAEEGFAIPADRVLPVKLRSRADVIFKIIDMEKKYPNDAELGKNIREAVLSWKEE